MDQPKEDRWTYLIPVGVTWVFLFAPRMFPMKVQVGPWQLDQVTQVCVLISFLLVILVAARSLFLRRGKDRMSRTEWIIVWAALLLSLLGLILAINAIL